MKQHLFITLLFLLSVPTNYINAQLTGATCDEVAASDTSSPPLTIEECETAIPDNGDCCTCDPNLPSDPLNCDGEQCHSTSCSPSLNPSATPTQTPSASPLTTSPTEDPSAAPTTEDPSAAPTTAFPSNFPSQNPSRDPTVEPTEFPSENPTNIPTEIPSQTPSENPTENPTEIPTQTPSDSPSENPTEIPSQTPSESPSENPTEIPTQTPSESPSENPTEIPTQTPSDNPSENPTTIPTGDPTADPTADPTVDPTVDPSVDPTRDPTQNPTTAQPTMEPTHDPTLEPIESACEDCAFNITLVSIGNITIGPCPVEQDCECDDGLRSFTTRYLNDVSNADSITFYYSSGNTLACPIATNVSNQEEIVCTIDVSGATRFRMSTRFVIEYADGSEECEGKFDTSCTEDILGDFGDGCSDLVISSWTDISGGECTGNVSDTRPPTSAPVTSTTPFPTAASDSSSSSKKKKKNKKKWKYKDGNDESSNSDRRRRRRLGNGKGYSDSDSDDSVITDSWYTNKKCVPNCYQWGLQRGLSCGCYESCTAGALNQSCYEGNSFGYCGTGVCCCGGECISTECDYGSSSSDRRRSLLGSDRCSASSESGDGYYSYSEWFKDRCGLSESDSTDGWYSKSYSSDSDEYYKKNKNKNNRRRRQLLGASFGSMRKLHRDSSSSYGDRYDSITDNDAYNDFLIETCVGYEISGDLNDSCIESEVQIFLPLCENNFTDFNSSNLNASDISGIITDATFENGTNVESVEGVEFEGELGILVQLKDGNTQSFEICFGNVTVNAENVDSFNITTIDTSEGVAIYNTSDGEIRCEIDGLPCFNFFFDADCPETDDTYRSCDCDGKKMLEINLEYTDEGYGDITVMFYSGYKRGSVRGTTYNDGTAFELTEGDEITVTADSNIDSGFSSFRSKTGVLVSDTNGDTVCQGVIKRCDESIIDSDVLSCEGVGLTVSSWISGDGALCDDIARDESSSGENALIGQKTAASDPFKIFEELDPSIKYSLIGVLVTFVVLMLVACYICVARGYEGSVDSEDDIHAMHDIALKKKGSEVELEANEQEYAHAYRKTLKTEDAMVDDEYYDDDEVTVEMTTQNDIYIE